MRPAWVDVRGVPQAELHDHGRGYPYEVGDLVVPDEAAEVVGDLDVDVERQVGGGPDGRELREAEIRRDVVRVGAEVLHSFDDRKSTRLNSSHANISYAVFCLKKKKSHNSI